MANKYFHYTKEEHGDSLPYLKLIEILSEYDLKGTPKQISFDNKGLLLRYNINEVSYSLNDFYLPVQITSINSPIAGNEISIVLKFDELIDDSCGSNIRTKIFNQISALKTLNKI